MELTKEYLSEQIGMINELLFSGSLHEIDQACNISAKLYKNLTGN